MLLSSACQHICTESAETYFKQSCLKVEGWKLGKHYFIDFAKDQRSGNCAGRCSCWQRGSDDRIAAHIGRSPDSGSFVVVGGSCKSGTTCIPSRFRVASCITAVRGHYLRNQTRSGKQILLWKTSMFPSRCKYHISYISYIHKSPFRPLWASGFFRSSSDTILEASSDLRSTPQDQSNRCKDNLSSTKQCLVHRWVTTSACPVGCPFPSTS